MFPANVKSTLTGRYIKDNLGVPDATNKILRTYVATQIALGLVSVQGPRTFTSEKEMTKAKREVAQVVTESLGNTVDVALKSYMDPRVFEDWRVVAP